MGGPLAIACLYARNFDLQLYSTICNW